MGAKGMLIDITRCVGCGACHGACAEANGNPETPMETWSDKSWTAVVERDGVWVRQMCMHCEDPACASVCPVAALRKTPEGPVTYDASRCMGCRYCMMACPFEAPKYEWDKRVPLVRKCQFCDERQANGQMPACAEACPAEATLFGDREELLAEARRRIQEAPDEYVSHIYGEHEVGGTSILFIAPRDFASLGFPVDLQHAPLPELTYSVLSKIPKLALVGGTALFGLHWIIHRRMTLATEAESQRRAGRNGGSGAEAGKPAAGAGTSRLGKDGGSADRNRKDTVEAQKEGRR